jgi:hypothetical protein
MTKDPSIRLWKTSNPQIGYPNWWNCWRSPDVFVDNDGDRLVSFDGTFKYYKFVDESGEPIKGYSKNRLFAVVRNLGTNAVNGVQVAFSYSPYGVVAGTLYQHVHFKTISTVTVNLNAAGTSSAEKEIEVQWDLSDPTEDNGGLWPAPVAFFSHFCVRVNIIYPYDSTPTNNWTQHNLANITSSSACPPFYLLVANTDDESMENQIEATSIPENCRIKLRGVDRSKKPFSTVMWSLGSEEETKDKRGKASETTEKESGEPRTNTSLGSLFMKPKEERLITLGIIPTEEKQGETENGQLVLKKGDKILGGVTFNVHKRKPEIGVLPRERLQHVPRFILVTSHQINRAEKKQVAKRGER